MITDAFNGLRALGTSIYEALLLPGQLILAGFTDVAPEMLASVGTTTENGGLLYATTALFWLLVVFIARTGIDVANNLRFRYIRYKEAICFRLSIEWRFFRQRLERIAGYISGKRAEPIVEPPTVYFDKLDILVLEFAAAKGPGFAISAPEIAEELSLRPSEIQERLDKLTRFTMLQSVIGSTDGYENFRLTQAGETYASMLQGKRPATAVPAPKAANDDNGFIPDGIHLGS